MIEYLPSLQRQHNEFIKRRQFQVSDIILMFNQSSARSQYPLVRIIKTYSDPSGMMRNVTLRAHNTNAKYGNPLFPNERPAHPIYEWDTQKITLLEFPRN